MILLFWSVLTILLIVAGLVLPSFRSTRFAIPWIGLVTVVVGTALAFSTSATLMRGGSDGVGIGLPITFMYGLIGLGIVLVYVRFRPVPFVPLGAIVAGVIHIASFYAYFPPFNPNQGQLIFAGPGFLLVAYGAYLWYRNGFAGPLKHKSVIPRLALALTIVAGLGTLGFTIYYLDRPDSKYWWVHPPDFPRIAESSDLVVEGVVLNKDSVTYKYRRPHGRAFNVRYTLYEMEVSETWRGSERKIVHFAVPHYIRVQMTVGRQYLIFSGGIASRENLPHHRSVGDPYHVWTADNGRFYPSPIIAHKTPITRHFVRQLLESQPYVDS